MLYGMGTVVVFLTLLVFVTSFMSMVVERYFPPAPEPESRPRGSTLADATLMAVITAAIHKHRSSRRNRENKS